MKIIVLNCGSSSIKYQLFEMPQVEVLAKGIVDKVGLKGALIKHERNDGKELKVEGEILDHKSGIEYLLGVLTDPEFGSLKSLKDIDAVGHRVVHGAEDFSGSVAITHEVIRALEISTDLAPLHNPPNLKGIYAMQQLLPDVPQAGVFDTAYHQTMPEYSYLYGIPYSLYEKHKIRRYGFHGTSHKYVSARACEILGEDIATKKIVTCHLGNGASMAAILYGKGNWVIIGGDWNMNPPGFDPDKITTGDKTFTVETEKIPNDFLPKGWKWIYDEKRPTNRSVITSYTKGETPTTIIDFFLLSPNIQCLNVETINFAFSFSDHNPVFLEALLSNCH
jgi:hypothetical protein